MLLEIEKKIASFIEQVGSSFVQELFAKIQHGKMLRSKLMLAICPKHPEITTLCAIIEMIQIASLLHDDVIDEAHIRRGSPSINAVFGNKNAIMLGDIFYAQAFFKLTSFDKNISQNIAECVVRLSRGEMHDVVMGRNFQGSREKYFSMVEDKTASLIASSARNAAVLANLDFEKYYSYGLNLGIAFQIIDDLLDVFGDEKKLGKPVMNDYVEGKTTLPYLLLHQNLSQEDKQKLESYFKVSSVEAKEWISEKMKEKGIFKETQDMARFFANKALESIEGENNLKLEEIIKNMIYREF